MIENVSLGMGLSLYIEYNLVSLYFLMFCL